MTGMRIYEEYRHEWVHRVEHPIHGVFYLVQLGQVHPATAFYPDREKIDAMNRLNMSLFRTEEGARTAVELVFTDTPWPEAPVKPPKGGLLAIWELACAQARVSSLQDTLGWSGVAATHYRVQTAGPIRHTRDVKRDKLLAVWGEDWQENKTC